MNSVWKHFNLMNINVELVMERRLTLKLDLKLNGYSDWETWTIISRVIHTKIVQLPPNSYFFLF